MLTKKVNGEEVIMSPEEEAEIRAKWDAFENNEGKLRYRQQRAKKYPAIEDQIDLLWKVVDQLVAANTITVPDDVSQTLTTIKRIKRDHPKPADAPEPPKRKI